MDHKHLATGQGIASSQRYLPNTDRKTRQTPGVQGASGWAIAGLSLLHATKALVTQGVAFGVMIGSRMIARELLEAAKSANEEDSATALILTTTVLATCAFDQLVTKRATSMLYGWVSGKKDGTPAGPVGWKTGAVLAMVPTALSAGLIVREWYGSSDNPGIDVLTIDLASMMIGWRAGRLSRDMGQQGVARFLPKLLVVDMDTGKPLTSAQKKTFDDLRLSCQLTAYSITVFTGAFVTTPALRGYLGSDERADSANARLYAMLAPMINSVLVEAFDEVISLLAHCLVALRQDRVVKVVPGERPKELGKAMLDQGSMRAFMGVFVTDLAQIILSIDRGADFFKALGTAIGSVAISIMEIRAKSVGVQSGVRDNARTFKALCNELVDAAARVTGLTFTDKQRGVLRAAINEARKGFVQGGWGTQALSRTEHMTGRELDDLVRMTLSDNAPRAIKFEATPKRLQTHKINSQFKPESSSQARRLLGRDSPVPALPLFRELSKGKSTKPPVATQSPDVLIDIKAPSGTAQPAGTTGSQPVSLARPDRVPLMSSIGDSDGPAFGTVQPVPSGLGPPQETEIATTRFHQNPIDLPLRSPRVERQAAASSHAFPACDVVDNGGKTVYGNDGPLSPDLELSIQAPGGGVIHGTVDLSEPHEQGFVNIRTPFQSDLKPYGQVIADALSAKPLLKVRIAGVNP